MNVLRTEIVFDYKDNFFNLFFLSLDLFFSPKLYIKAHFSHNVPIFLSLSELSKSFPLISFAFSKLSNKKIINERVQTRLKLETM